MTQDSTPSLETALAPPAVAARAFDLSAAPLPTPLTSLVGRERELASLHELLNRDGVRLLTLTGPGGVGKTRLAVAAAHRIAPQFADGIAYIPLNAIDHPGLVAATTFHRLGGADLMGDFTIERFQAVLANRAVLLVFDNFEHLLPAAPLLHDLLAASSRLKILITSRVALRLSGEHEFLVSPLPLLEPSRAAAIEQSPRSDAVQLFILRAAAARADFAVTAETVPLIGDICRRLDGLPLAIELAASRVTHLSPRALLERMDRPGAARLPLLSGGSRDLPARQQTMRDAIAWSYALLDPAEQSMFQHLTIFAGGFSLAAAAAVNGSDEAAALEVIGALVAKNLIRYEGDANGDPRYGMLETIREFGLEQLVASRQTADVRQRHAHWALDFAERAARNEQASLKDRIALLEQEYANLRGALTWFQDRGDGPYLVRLASLLWPFWEERAHYSEGRRWLQAALAIGAEAAPADRLSACTGAGTMAWRQSDFPAAIQYHKQALALAMMIGDREAEAFALNNLAAQAAEQGDFDSARVQLEASLAIAREAGSLVHIIRALHNLGHSQRMQGDSAAALRSMEEVLDLARASADDVILPAIVDGLGLAALGVGDYARARSLIRESLTLAITSGRVWSVIEGLESHARLAAAIGRMEPAVLLFGAVETMREQTGFRRSPIEIAEIESVMPQLRSSLGDERFESVWASGQSLTQQQMIDEAFRIDVDSQVEAPPARAAPPFGLTSREREVLQLLAAGSSNPDIAARLYISPATAARHVANIYNKLGVDSRAKAAAAAVKLGLG